MKNNQVISTANTQGYNDELPSFIERTSVDVPLNLLLDLHNSLPSDDEGRVRIKAIISACGDNKEKAHWARGIIVDEEGNLQADEERYLLAVYRGKQETRIAAAEKEFDRLKEELEFVSHFQECEQGYVNKLEERCPAGIPLVEVRELGSSAMRLKEKAIQLKSLVQQMEYGMTECLVSSDRTFPQIVQSKT
jgi:hypothetical protein